MSKKLFLSKKILAILIIILTAHILSQPTPPSPAEIQNPSYIKIYKGEVEILQEINKDFIGMSLESNVNGLNFTDVKNIIDPIFPNSELDLFNISLQASQFSLGENSQINFSEDYSLIVQDMGNISSYAFFQGNYTYRDTVAKTNETDVFSVSIFAEDVLYNKNYTIKDPNNPSNNTAFKLAGNIAFIWGSPIFKFSEKTSQNAQKFITSKFKDNYYKVFSDQISKELDNGLKKYYAKTNYSQKARFSLSKYLSAMKTVNLTLSFDVNRIKLNAPQLNDSQSQVIQVKEYSGFYASYDVIPDKTPESDFDIYSNDTGINISNLRNALFVDKFLLEYLMESDEFTNFFIRREAKLLDFPQALEIDMNVREVSKIIPEIARVFPLSKKVFVNFAFFSPQLIFRDNSYPQIRLRFDFTFYVRDFNGDFKQILTCQADLYFDIEVKVSSTKNFKFNFALNLSKVDHLKMSNDFYEVEIERLRYLIEETVAYGVEKNGGMMLENDLDLNLVFEDKFMVKYFNSGILFYEYLN